ncbi:hypothetical protein LUZ61_001388 [Rhynchospora tenuis]|uniref:WASH1 WAHD domain-containing protein n=1 Tax=Rhynchospora tenuis TaxID=198213 RepID=A0AAD5ZGY7_9POAL|nr:hypothetical protein LUZ61_001388 [Rhynchospora tenuis]
MGRTLHELQRAADRVFGAVSLKIAEEQDKLSEISNRIKVAKANISKISNSESEVKIVSSGLHPLANTRIDDSNHYFMTRMKKKDGTLGLFQFFSE